MTGAITASTTTAAQTPALRKDDIAGAARQFETLLLSQILKSARDAGESWLGAGNDASSTTAIEMAEEQFAAALAASGGVGLAGMVTESLKQREGAEAGFVNVR